MFIKRIIIDGFKSYANRTVIDGWDKQFNAITGLNGSGKSNVLDAICFVLGISSLSHVRAQDIKDLVYKQGQSRVQKASVTIIFDNSDRSASPLGYEDVTEINVTRQVVIGGKNKYMINGQTAQLNRVQNLFHSVSLNVNNPHFLIMQGRITKVCNMKPAELLSLIEEATGTRMYENKKMVAVHTLEKKQAKVDEISKLLTDELSVTMERLRTEKTKFLRWQTLASKIERLKRYTTAYEYTEYAKQIQHNLTSIEENEHLLVTCANSIEETKEQLQKLKFAIAEEERKRNNNEELQLANDKLQELCKEQDKLNEKLLNIREQVHTLEFQNTGTRTTIEKIQKQMDKLVEKRKDVQSKLTLETNERNILQDKCNALEGSLIGFSGGANDQSQETGGGINAQLIQAEQTMNTIDSDIAKHTSTLQYYKEELEQQKARKQSDEAMYVNISKEIEKQEQQVETATNELLEQCTHVCTTNNFHISSNGPIHTVLQSKHKIQQQIQELENQITRVKYAMNDKNATLQARLNFQYQTNANLNDQTVKGIFAKLIDVKDSSAAYALEVAAGNRLYQIVVDNRVTGHALLEQRRTLRQSQITVIPLAQIQAKTIPHSVLELAKQLGQDKVDSAINLVDFDPSVRAAAEYVFGNTFICQDNVTAEKITFNHNIRTRSVTLLGDVLDPQGTITGGSRPKTSGVLLALRDLQAEIQKIDTLQHDIQQLQKQLSSLEVIEQEQERINNVKRSIENLRVRITSSTYVRAEAKIEEYTREITRLEELLQQCHIEKNRVQVQLETLHRMLKNLNSGDKQARAKMEKEFKQLKVQVEKKNEEVNVLQTTLERFDIELESLEKDALQYKSEQEKFVHSKQLLDEDIDRCIEQLHKQEQLVQAQETQVQNIKTSMSQQLKLLEKLYEERVQLTSNIAQYETDKKVAEVQIRKLKQENEQMQQKRKALVKANTWIVSEERRFGEVGTDYDFSGKNIQDCRDELQQAQNEEAELGRTIDRKIQATFDQTEREFNDLVRKKETIEKDKANIERVIAQLDQKKKQALQSAWESVNASFNNIFSVLLPGSSARLKKHVNSQDIIVGLEMLVGFGGVEKESLSELSGGQRSLLALSLILALLRFKPAPMYILDEVDAALDLSHTQNIGVMLKKYFPQSQFIVVSLKEGMFNNANVLFRTKFVDGVSTITCTKNVNE